MKQAAIEYGDSKMNIEVPDTSTIITPQTHYVDPPTIDPREATIKALNNPLGIEPLSQLAKPGMKVAIAFPDRVKGGTHELAHRKVSIPLIIDELVRAGVFLQDIKLICAIGLHRKNTKEEMEEYLGREVVRQFWPDRIVNHDAEDPEGMVTIGYDDMGNYVDVNRDIYEADIAIMIGHVQGNPYGGYSGGYKMCVTGVTGWKCIRSHHTPRTMHRPDFVPVNVEHSHMRKQFNSIGNAIEKAMGKRFYCVDAVLNTYAQVVGVYAGVPDLVQHESWKLAKERTELSLNESESDEPYDILVFGQPRSFHYGPGMGTNPILMLQSVGSQIARHKMALRDNAVVICASICDGWFNDEWFPSYRKLYNKLHTLNDFSEATRFEDEISNNAEDIYKYRHGYAYHPFHALSMLSMGGVALKHTSAIFVPGAREGGYARAMGMQPVNTFEDAMKQAEKYVGKKPRVLVQEQAFTATAVHLKL